MIFKINAKIYNYILETGSRQDAGTYKVLQEIDDNSYGAIIKMLPETDEIAILNIYRLDYFDDDSNESEDMIRKYNEIPVEDELLAIDFYCTLFEKSKISEFTIKDVEVMFDRLGILIKITEQADSYKVSVHDNIFIEIHKSDFEQGMILQKHNLFNAFMIEILSELLWHNEKIIRLSNED